MRQLRRDFLCVVVCVDLFVRVTDDQNEGNRILRID